MTYFELSKCSISSLEFVKILTHFQTLDLIRLQSGAFSDFIKVNITIGICAVSHVDCDDTLVNETGETGEIPAQLTVVLMTPLDLGLTCPDIWQQTVVFPLIDRVVTLLCTSWAQLGQLSGCKT